MNSRKGVWATIILIEIVKGNKIAFVGKNGEGKTTLAKMIVNEIDFSGDISLGHKVKMGYSVYSDDLTSAESNEITRFNTTLEWHGSPDFYLFAEFQNNNYEDEAEGREDSNQFTVGMRYNFDYSF